MSKEYTFQEVIQRIKPGETYRCTDKSINVKEIFMYETGQYIQIVQNNSDYAIMISPYAKYKLAHLPVSFIEAAEAFNEGKTIVGVMGEFNFIYHPQADNSFVGTEGENLTAAQILKCKWYIEEAEE